VSFSAGAKMLWAISLLCALALVIYVPKAHADIEFCPPGTGAAQCDGARGIAVDNENGRLYVADRNNNRIDVFEEDGDFLLAFGWGVADGTTNALQSCGPAAIPPTVS
jgi:DNA-binding beta-propeller fold protein YncE